MPKVVDPCAVSDNTQKSATAHAESAFHGSVDDGVRSVQKSITAMVNNA